MTIVTIPQNSLSSGELDPALRGAHNLKVYSEGASRVRNAVRRATGGMGRRGGTDYLTSQMREGRLAPFEFSDEQRYILNFCNAAVDVYDMNGVLLQQIGGAPWTLAMVDSLTLTQNGDVMVITNCAPTMVLTRTSATTFALSTFAFDLSTGDINLYAPFYKFALATTTLTPSASTGSITLTTSVAHWVPAHVGKRVKVYDAQVLITAYTSSTQVTGTVQGTLIGKLDIDPFRTEKDSTTVVVTHSYHGLATGASITFSGSNDVGYVPSSWFNATFAVTVIDEHHYSIVLSGLTYTVREDANFDGVNENTTWNAARSSIDGGGPNVKFSVAGTPTRNWVEESINDVRGYPAASGYSDGRLWLGGTDSQPDGLWGSWSLEPYRFDVGTGLPAQSVQTAIGSEDVSRIRHIVSGDDMQVFTALREYIIVGQQGAAPTPTAVRCKEQSNAGVSTVPPVAFDGAVLFVQQNGLSVSEFGFSEREGKYLPVDVSALAGHLIRSPRCVAVSPGTITQAEKQALFVNSDGTVAVFHSLRNENIAGWGLWTIGEATVRSVCAIGNYIFMLVYSRTGYRLYRLAETGMHSLDGQIRHVNGGGETTSWTVDARVRGGTYHLMSEKGYLGTYEIPLSGEVELDVAVQYLTVGDAFYFEIMPLPPYVSLPEGTKMGEKQRILSTKVDVIDGGSLRVGTTRLNTLSAQNINEVGELNGVYEVRHLGYSRSPAHVITQDEPVHVEAIVSLVQKVRV